GRASSLRSANPGTRKGTFLDISSLKSRFPQRPFEPRLDAPLEGSDSRLRDVQEGEVSWISRGAPYTAPYSARRRLRARKTHLRAAAVLLRARKRSLLGQSDEDVLEVRRDRPNLRIRKSRVRHAIRQLCISDRHVDHRMHGLAEDRRAL